MLSRLVVRTVNGKNRREPGYVEHFFDRILQCAQHHLAVGVIETLGRKDKHAQTGAADIIELCKIDYKAALAGFYLSENFLLKGLRGCRIQASR